MASRPKKANIHRPKHWFAVLQTTNHSQTAVMTLAPGQSSGEEAEAHAHSEQVLLLVAGTLAASIGGTRSTLHAGDVVIIPPGIKHRFANHGQSPAVTFSVYAPPEYPPGTRG